MPSTVSLSHWVLFTFLKKGKFLIIFKKVNICFLTIFWKFFFLFWTKILKIFKKKEMLSSTEEDCLHPFYLVANCWFWSVVYGISGFNIKMNINQRDTLSQLADFFCSLSIVASSCKQIFCCKCDLLKVVLTWARNVYASLRSSTLDLKVCNKMPLIPTFHAFVHLSVPEMAFVDPLPRRTGEIHSWCHDNALRLSACACRVFLFLYRPSSTI